MMNLCSRIILPVDSGRSGDRAGHASSKACAGPMQAYSPFGDVLTTMVETITTDRHERSITSLQPKCNPS